MSGFEAQCDCELDSPGMMSEHPVEFRLERWTEWALYLKKRIETHYRPAIAELKAELQLFHDFLGTPITGHFDERSISGRFKEMVALEADKPAESAVERLLSHRFEAYTGAGFRRDVYPLEDVDAALTELKARIEDWREKAEAERVRADAEWLRADEAEAALYYDEDGDTAQTWQTRAEVLEAKLAAAEATIEAQRGTITHQTNIINADNGLRDRAEQAEERVRELEEENAEMSAELYALREGGDWDVDEWRTARLTQRSN